MVVFRQTAIAEAANLPISIIIVGVGMPLLGGAYVSHEHWCTKQIPYNRTGGADFSSMEELDGDDVKLTPSCARDIVQV
jgi:hypothetical protein